MIRINIHGMLTREPDPFCELSYAEIRDAIEKALAGDDEILLDVDSHGGDSIGVKAVADYVYAHRDRISAHVSGVCASAAYYIAAATRHISAAEDAIIGSVGTIGWPPDVEGARVATLSPLKNSGADLQTILDDSCERFLRDVARYRGFSGDLNEIAQHVGAGAMLTARDALSHQLIDEVKMDDTEKSELDVEGIAAMLPRLLEKLDELAAKVDSADERVGLLEQRLDELKRVDEEEAPAAACGDKETRSEDTPAVPEEEEKREDEIMACVIDAAKAAGLIRTADEGFAHKLAMASPALFRDYLTSRPKQAAAGAKLAMSAKSHAPVARTRDERAKQIMQATGVDYATALAQCMEG